MSEEKPRKFAKDFLEKWGRAEREEGPADEALAKLDEELKEYPDDAARWYRRGSLLLDLERWEEALAALRRVEELAPAHPRLHLALAFALGKLGRPDEAAAAQHKALETTALSGREPEPADAEEGLRSLAEELAEEVLEEEVVDRLQELAELEVEPKLGPAAEFEERLSSWAAAGYDVSPLRQVLEKEPDRARTAFFQFEQNVRKVQVLEETLNGLDRTGLEPAIDRLRALFRAPYQI